jgi:choline-sulfatase
MMFSKYAGLLVVFMSIFFIMYFGSSSEHIVDEIPDYLCEGCNVLIISVECVRADHVSSLGYSRKTTPRLDAFGEENFVFELAFSQSPWTLPSLATLLTGIYPREHGVLGPKNRLDDVIPTLAEILGKRGYATYYNYRAWFPLSDMNFGKGFQTRGPGGNAIAFERSTKRYIQDQEMPFFIWLHYEEPHLPYDPPREYDGLFLSEIPDFYRNTSRRICLNTDYNKTEIEYFKALYDREIFFADEYIGNLIDYLKEEGLYDNTLIILLSDHGEEFWEHGKCDHGHSLYDELVHIPMFVRIPTIEGPKRIPYQVSQVDIMPTILDVLGIKDNWSSGESFIPMMIGEEKEDRVIFLEGIHPSYSRQKTAIRYRNHKLIHKPKIQNLEAEWELYDLSNDPGEMRNIWEETDDILLKTQLVSIIKIYESRDQHMGDEVVFDEEVESRLRDVGYL